MNDMNDEQGAVESTVIYCEQMKQAFNDYLEVGFKGKSNPRAYISCLDNSFEFAVRQRLSPSRIWLITDVVLLNTLSEKLRKNVIFRARDRKNYQLFQKAIEAYLQFIKNGIYKEFLNKIKEEDDISDKLANDITNRDVLDLNVNERKVNECTIVEAVTTVLKIKNFGLSIRQIYDEIIDRRLYSFKAINPINVLNVEVRRHCDGVNLPGYANNKKHFKLSHITDGVAFYVLMETDVNNVANAKQFAWNNQNKAEHFCIETEKNTDMLSDELNIHISDSNASELSYVHNVYDWKQHPSINGTKPVSICFSYNTETVLVTSWKALLMCVYEYAVREFPNVDIPNASLKNSRRKLCSYNHHEVSYAEKLKCGLYVDTAFSANDVVDIVRVIFNLCGANVEDIKIIYRNNSLSILQIDEKASAITQDLSEEEKNIITVFKETFPYSMNLGFVDLSKLKNAYNNKFKVIISLTDDSIYCLIRNNAIQTDPDAERYTHLNNLASHEVLSRIKQFINNEIDNGIQRVYAKPIYNTFKSDMGIAVNEDLLLTIIETAFGDEFKVNRKSMFVSARGEILTPTIGEEIAAAIVKLLNEDVMPFSTDEISQKLSGYPRNKIDSILSNGNESIVTVGSSQYACIDYVYISDEQIEHIKSIIAQGVKSDGCKAVDELYAEILETIPDIIDMNPEINKADIIKTIKHKIGGTYTIQHDRFVPKKEAR